MKWKSKKPILVIRIPLMMEIKGNFDGEWHSPKKTLMLINGTWLRFKNAFLYYKYSECFYWIKVKYFDPIEFNFESIYPCMYNGIQ